MRVTTDPTPETDHLGTARATQREATRAAVLGAAEGLFLTQGYEATSVRGIAETAGVSTGSVMAVGSKRALLVAVLERGFTLVAHQHASTRDVSAGRHEGLTFSDRVVALVEPYAALLAARAPLVRAYLGAVATDPAAGEVVARMAGPLREQLEHELRRAQGPVHPAPTRAAEALRLALMGAAFAWAASGQDDVDRLLADVRRAAAGVAPPGTSRGAASAR